MKKKLSDLCDVIFTGSSIKKEDMRDDSDVILYKVADVTDDDLDETHYTSLDAYERSSNKLQQYDLLITVTGAIGRTGVVRHNNKALISSGVMCLRFKDNKQIQAEYFKRYLNKIKDQLESVKSDSVVPRVSPTYIKDLVVDVPDIKKMKEILIKLMLLEYYLKF